MSDAVQETPAAQATPPPPEAPPADESISAHAAQFGRQPRESAPPAEPPRDSPREPQQPDKHRAQSQKARAEDVPRIAELTKKWRAEETRRQELETRLAELERRSQSAAPPAEPKAAAVPSVPRETAPTGFAEPEPSIDQFGNETDPYAAWQRALARWDRRKDAWEESQQRTQQENHARATQAAEQTNQELETRYQAYKTKAAEYAGSHPDFQAAIDSIGDVHLGPVLWRAILSLDNSPVAVHAIADDIDLIESLLEKFGNAEPNPTNVALARRRLQKAAETREKAASTGSAAPMKPANQAPRPPNPVRTGPMQAGDHPPGEGASIADHAKYWGKARR